jgi:pimeloyl-ACP methyl ester carboxylesterase
LVEDPRADVVGWSDGAIFGLGLAIRQPDRVGRIFAVAANTTPAGLKEAPEKQPAFAACIERAGHRSIVPSLGQMRLPAGMTKSPSRPTAKSILASGRRP